jgi:hypothetical protein
LRRKVEEGRQRAGKGLRMRRPMSGEQGDCVVDLARFQGFSSFAFRLYGIATDLTVAPDLVPDLVVATITLPLELARAKACTGWVLVKAASRG